MGLGLSVNSGARNCKLPDLVAQLRLQRVVRGGGRLRVWGLGFRVSAT